MFRGLSAMSAMVWLACSLGCGATVAPVAGNEQEPRAGGPEDPGEGSAEVEPDETFRAGDPASDGTGLRHLAVSWDALADPHEARALIVRTDMDWEALFSASTPDGTIDFRRSLVLGLVEPNVQSVRILEVRVEGGEVLVMAAVGLPNPRCGETPNASVDFVVVDTIDLPIRFSIERSTTEC